MNAGLELLLRVRHAGVAGRGLSPVDTRELASRIDLALLGKSEAEAFGFDPGWRRTFGASIVGENGNPASLRDFPGTVVSIAKLARVRRAELEAYFRGAFQRDLAHGQQPIGENGVLYAYLVARGGRLPSERTVRRELANNPPPGGQLSGASTTPTKRGA